MKTLTIRAIPGVHGQPGRIEINSAELQPAEVIVLLERAKAALLTQPVPALDGEPGVIEVAPAGAFGLKKLTG